MRRLKSGGLRAAALVLILALLVGRAVAPQYVQLDGLSVTLIIVAVVLVLVPWLESAKLPGGTELRFTNKLGAGEKLGQDVQARTYQEGGLAESAPDWPAFIDLPGDIRQLVADSPGDAIAAIRTALVNGLRIAAQGIGRQRNKMAPQDPDEMLEYVAHAGSLWPEQAGMLRALWDLTKSTPLKGQVSTVDAERVMVLAEILNDSFALGFSLNFQPNESWEENGLVCQYEHCIENMPLPAIPLKEHLEWRERIQDKVNEGFYDDHPSRKREFLAMLKGPVVAEDHPEEVDRTGACPIFGHFCPGGEETVKVCGPAYDWVKQIETK